MDCKISLELSDTDRNDLVCALEEIGFKKMPSHKEALFSEVERMVNEAYELGLSHNKRDCSGVSNVKCDEVVGGFMPSESTNSTVEETKGCPHCGARAFLGKNEDGGLEGYYVECRTCWCRTGTHAFDWEARQSWNNRA